MTDREKLLKLFDTYQMDYLETILNCFFMEYEDDFSAKRINDLIKDLTFRLKHKIEHLEQAQNVANEKARYIKSYLEGKMWKDEESAKANLQPQIKNAQAIIDACGRR